MSAWVRGGGGWRRRGLLGLAGTIAVAGDGLLGWLIDPRLVAPMLFVAVVMVLAHQAMWPAWRWRVLAAWLGSLPLCLFCVFVVAHHAATLALTIAAPGVVLLASFIGAGRQVRGFIRRRPAVCELVHVGSVVVLAALSSGRFGPRLDDSSLALLYATPAPAELSQVEMDQAVARVLAVVAAGPGLGGGRRASVDGPQRGLGGSRLSATHRLHVWLWLAGESPVGGSAAASTLAAALERATARALGRAEHLARWRAEIGRVRVMVEIAGPAVRLRHRLLHWPLVALVSLLSPVGPDRLEATSWLSQLSYEIAPGIDGLLWRDGAQSGGVLPAEPVLNGWLTPRVQGVATKVHVLLGVLGRRAGVGPDGWQRSSAELYKYRAFSFGRLGGGTPAHAVRLVRGNVLGSVVGRGEVLRGFGAAADWLARAARPDGRFDYDYLPTRDQSSGEYNLVRHAGAVYGLLHAYRVARGLPEISAAAPIYLAAAERAFDWLRPRLRRPPGGEAGMVALIDEGGVVSSGAAAMTLMALVEPGPKGRGAADGVPRVGPLLGEPALRQGLARFVEAMIDPRGRLFARWSERRAASEVATEPLYYPGEAMLALVRLYRVTGSPRWLSAARRIADARVHRYWLERPIPDHWVIQALAELYRATGVEQYAATCLQMADRYAADIYRADEAPFVDYRGAYRLADDMPRTTRACSRSEAMGAAFELARERGRDGARYRWALLSAAGHVLNQQFRADNSFYLPNAARARGAIRMGLVDQQCRIDNNQHALVALSHALTAFEQ